MQPVPEPQAVLEDLSRLVPVIYDALEASLNYTREYFDEHNQGIDPYLAPALVRYNVKLYLRAAGQTAEDFFDLDTMANNGLLLTNGRYKIRILKSDDGDLPPPGPSKAKQAFYHQLPLVFSSKTEDDDAPLNLVVVWDVTSDYRLRGLSLVCPKSGNTSRSSVEKHWVWPLTPQALLASRAPTISKAIVPEDLPIEYLPEPKVVGEKSE
ncbi:MAG: hypothetical protein M1377_00215 [Deltaproteobacteria bacterium]|nr:hypothetical protein [Deltaproteobacteria bacterium]